MRRTVVNDRVPVEAADCWLWQQSRRIKRNEQRGEHVVDLSCSRVAHVDHPAEYAEQQVPLPSDEKANDTFVVCCQNTKLLWV